MSIPGKVRYVANLVELWDDLPDVSGHPEGKEEDGGELAEEEEEAEVVDMSLPHALERGEGGREGGREGGGRETAGKLKPSTI